MDRNEAYVNVLAMARDAESFERGAVEALSELGFDCRALEDCEPIEERSAKFVVDEELLALAAEVHSTGKARIGRFYTWRTNDE